MTDYVDTEDEEVCLGVMIEKTTVVDDLEEILSVSELGFVFIGPSDLSVQMGYLNDRSNPTVEQQIEEIRDVCLDAGVPVGGVAHDPEDAAMTIDNGYQILRIGGELEAAQVVVADRLEETRK